MSVGTRASLRILGAGLLLGLLADLVLRSTPPGLNVSIWVASFSVAAALLRRRVPWWSAAPALVFALCIAWRDSPWLISLDVSAIVVALALGCLLTPAGNVSRAGIADYAVGLGAAALASGAGTALLLFEEVRWEEVPRGGRSQQLAAVGRGALIAVPLLLVFGALFVTADAVFGSLLGGFSPGARTLVHLLVIGVWTWIAAGLLRLLQLSRTETVALERPFTLGATELTVALGLLNALFFAFVLVQFRTSVGGRGFVLAHVDVTYSSYARQGFFQLVAVAALVLPVVLLADWLAPRTTRAVRVLSGTLVLLLFCVIASALERMRLYEHRFGLTELRFYTTGFMFWLAVVFVWFLATVLRKQRERFAVGALVSGFAAILIVHAVNPDALIARVDARRPQPDIAYLSRLSDDATPTLVHELPRVSPVDRRRLAAYLARHRHPHGWRSWNLARPRAARFRSELQRLER